MRKISIDGTIHTVGAAFKSLIWELIMLPQDGSGNGMLKPKIASAPSSTITTATPSSAIDSIAGSTFGRTSRNMTRQFDAPCARAAMTKSR